MGDSADTAREKRKKKVIVKKAPGKGASSSSALRKRQDEPSPPNRSTKAKPSSLQKTPTYRTTARERDVVETVEGILEKARRRPRASEPSALETRPFFGPAKNTARLAPLNQGSRARIANDPMSRDDMLRIALDDAIRRNPAFQESARETGLSRAAKFWLGESLATPGFDPSRPWDWIDPLFVYADIASFGGTAPIRSGAKAAIRGARAGREAGRKVAASPQAQRLALEESGELSLQLQSRADKIREADPSINLVRAWGLAFKESRRPGYLGGLAERGELPQSVADAAGLGRRELEGEFVLGPGRAVSRSIGGRLTQGVYDKATARLAPTRRFSHAVRSARALQREAQVEEHKIASRIARAEKEIRRALPSGWRRQGNMRDFEEAMWAVLEAPAEVAPRQAVEAKLEWVDHLLLSPLTDADERAVRLLTNQRARLSNSLKGDRLDSPEFLSALGRAQEIANESERLFQELTGIPQEILDVRRNRMAQWLQQTGALPEGVSPVGRAYLPHLELADDIRSGVAPVGFSATGRTVGRPRKPRGTLETRPWQGTRASQGRVNTRIRVLTDTLRNRIRYSNSLQSRRALWEVAQPIEEGGALPPGGFVFIRNPDEAAEKITPEIRLALEDPERYAEEFGDDALRRALDDADGSIHFADDESTHARISSELDEWVAGEATWGGKELQRAPTWHVTAENTRVVPERVARALFGDAFAISPRGSFSAVMGTINNLSRANYIYLPYAGGRYVSRNTVQNQILLAMTNPRAFAKTKKAIHLARSDKELWDLIKTETGTVRAQAGLPDIHRGTSAAQRTERGLADVSKRVGGTLGDVSDEPWRVSDWLQYAEEGYGYKTRDEKLKLLTSDDPRVTDIRRNIRQYVREDMLDFDTLPPWVKETLTRYFFIFPFRVAAAKWPIMYAREYPLRAALVSAAAYWGYGQLTEPGIPMSARERGRVPEGMLGPFGGKDFGWLDPLNPAAETVENIASARSRPGALAEWFQPGLRETIQALGPQGNWPDIGQAATDIIVPGSTTARKVARGGSIKDQILRALGSKIEVPAFRQREREGEIQKTVAAVNSLGGRDGSLGKYPYAEIVRSEKTWQAYQDLATRSEYAARDLGRDLTSKEKAVLLSIAIQDNWGEANVRSIDAILSGTDEEAQEWFDRASGKVKAARTYVRSRATERQKENEERAAA